MNKMEFKVPIPKGMEIDEERSTFQLIKFKPIKPKRWRDDKNAVINGYYVSTEAWIKAMEDAHNCAASYNIFATKKQAKSALAMARISQIMANDERFGGVVTDVEWADPDIYKYCIERAYGNTCNKLRFSAYCFLAFHTEKQRDLFLTENEDLVKDYLMME